MSTISSPLTYSEYVRRHRDELTNNAKDELLSESEFNKFGRLEKLYLAKQRQDWDYVQSRSTWVDYPDADDEYSDKPPPVFVSSNPFGRKINDPKRRPEMAGSLSGRRYISSKHLPSLATISAIKLRCSGIGLTSEI